MRLKLLFKSILFCYAISASQALGGGYVGGGISVSRTQYKTTNSTLVGKNFAGDLRSLARSINSTAFHFNGTQEDFLNLINTTYMPTPTPSNTGSFFITIDNGNFGTVCTLTQDGLTVIQDPSIYSTNNGCSSNFNPNASAVTLDLSNGSKDALTAIQTDIGRVLGEFYIAALGDKMQMTFANTAELYTFYNTFGDAILANIAGKEDYTLSDVQTAMLEPTNPASQLFNLSDTGALNFGFYPGDSNFQSLYAQIIQPAFLQTATELNIVFVLTDLSTLSPAQIIELASIKDSASSIDIQGTLLAGAGRIYNRTYFGFETALDFGKQKTGKSNDGEIELSSNYTASVSGRFGYLFLDSVMNYVNVGMALRDYKIEYNGSTLAFSSRSGMKLHYLLGTGMEFFTSRQLSFFSELNYLVTTSPIDSGSPDGKKLDVATGQLRIGARYYPEGVKPAPKKNNAQGKAR